MTTSDRLAATGGTFTINDTSVHTLNFNTIQVNKETVVAVLELEGVDVLSSFISTPASSITNTVITCNSDTYFSKIQLTSGEVTLSKQ